MPVCFLGTPTRIIMFFSGTKFPRFYISSDRILGLCDRFRCRSGQSLFLLESDKYFKLIFIFEYYCFLLYCTDSILFISNCYHVSLLKIYILWCFLLYQSSAKLLFSGIAFIFWYSNSWSSKSVF